MKSTNVIPLVSGYEISVKDLLYKERDRFGKVLKEVEVSVIFYCDEKGNPIQAECKKPFFVAGSTFFERMFGKSQTRLVKKICNKLSKNAMKKINRLLKDISLIE